MTRIEQYCLPSAALLNQPASASEAMNEDPLPAAAYNCIPLLEHQPAISHEVLLDLGHLFVRHELHHNWGVTTLHRHADIPADHVMVNMRQSPDLEICEPQSLRSLSRTALFPTSLLLNEDQRFQAYEYEVGVQRTALPLDFLCDLRELLLSRHVEQVIALATTPKPAFSTKIETLILEDDGSVRGMRSTPQAIFQGQSEGVNITTTSWIFRQGSEVEILEVKACRTLPTGLHEVTKDD